MQHSTAAHRFRTVLTLMATVAVLGPGIAGVRPAAAEATYGICHATGSGSHPWEYIPPSSAAYQTHYGNHIGPYGGDRFATPDEDAAGTCYAPSTQTPDPPTSTPTPVPPTETPTPVPPTETPTTVPPTETPTPVPTSTPTPVPPTETPTPVGQTDIDTPTPPSPTPTSAPTETPTPIGVSLEGPSISRGPTGFPRLDPTPPGLPGETPTASETGGVPGGNGTEEIGSGGSGDGAAGSGDPGTSGSGDGQGGTGSTASAAQQPPVRALPDTGSGDTGSGSVIAWSMLVLATVLMTVGGTMATRGTVRIRR